MKENRFDLIINGIGYIAIIDGNYYITDEDLDVYVKTDKETFKKKLDGLKWIETGWCKELKEDYHRMIEMVNKEG